MRKHHHHDYGAVSNHHNDSHHFDFFYHEHVRQHPDHHHHNKLGNVLHCPNDNCLAGLINSGFAHFFDYNTVGSDSSSDYKFGPAEHDHDDKLITDYDEPTEHAHDWQHIRRTLLNDYYLCDCGASRFQPIYTPLPT